ncbi:hypothetical protein ARMSODRAFT_553151 [Armillaria solidipes]|uniref:Uncharacterized protein n=1 Tax=Armillaria solidipes TaxID=1076256 RepID=A0A2H3AWJ5_9AGAR|nr:hypothetical protein ARMSODRAFT_553151 [Armillaria solidipes]
MSSYILTFPPSIAVMTPGHDKSEKCGTAFCVTQSSRSSQGRYHSKRSSNLECTKAYGIACLHETNDTRENSYICHLVTLLPLSNSMPSRPQSDVHLGSKGQLAPSTNIDDNKLLSLMLRGQTPSSSTKRKALRAVNLLTWLPQDCIFILRLSYRWPISLQSPTSFASTACCTASDALFWDEHWSPAA